MTAFQQLPSATGDNEPPTARTDPSPRRASNRTPSVEKTPRATAEEEAPVMARTNGLFGTSKNDSAAAQSRRRAAGTVTANGRSDKGTEFKSARSAGGSGWPKWATGRKSAGDSTPRPIVSTNPEMHKSLVSQLESVKAENEALKKENRKMSEELVIRARAIAQHRDQNSKLLQEINICGRHPFQRVRQMSSRDASAGPLTPHLRGTAPDDQGCPCIPEGVDGSLGLESHGRRDSADYRTFTRRGSISRPLMDDDVDSLRAEIDALTAQQEELKVRNTELKRLNDEAEEERALLENELESLRERARAQCKEHEAALEEKTASVLADLEQQRSLRNEEIATLQTKKEQLEEEVVDLNARVEGQRSTLTSVVKEVQSVEDRLAHSKGELSEAETALRSTSKLKTDIEDAIRVAQSELRDLEVQIGAVRKELEDLRASNAQERRVSHTLREEAATLQEQCDQLKKNLTESDSTVRRLTAEQSALTQSVAALEETGDRLASARTELQGVLAQKAAALKALDEATAREVALSAEQARRKPIERDLGLLQTSLEDAGRQLSIALEERRNAESGLKELRDQISLYESRADTLKREVGELEKAADIAASELERARTEVAAEAKRLDEAKTAVSEASKAAETARAAAVAAEAAAAESATRQHELMLGRDSSMTTETPRPEPLLECNTLLEGSGMLQRHATDHSCNDASEGGRLRAEEELGAQQMEAENLKASVEALEERKRLREAEFARLSEKCEELTRKLEELRGQESAFARSRASSRSVLSLGKEELDSYAIASAFNKLDDRFGQHLTIADRVGAAHREYESTIRAVETARRELEETSGAYEKAKAELEESRTSLVSLAATRATMESALSGLREEQESLVSNINALQRDHESITNAVALAKAELLDTTKHLTLLRSDAEAMSERLESIRSEYQKALNAAQVAEAAAETARRAEVAAQTAQSAAETARDAEFARLRSMLEETRVAEASLKALKERIDVGESHSSELQVTITRDSAAATSAALRRKEAEDHLAEIEAEVEKRREEESARAARAEDDRARSRAQYEAALRDAQAELRALQQSRSLIETSLKEKEGALKTVEGQWRQMKNRVRQAQSAAYGSEKSTGIARLRAAAEQAVADVLLKDIEGLDARLEKDSPTNSYEVRSSRPWASPMSPHAQIRPLFGVSSPPWGSPPPTTRRATHDGHLALSSLQTSPLGRRKSDLFPLREEEHDVPSTTSASQPQEKPQFGRTRSSSSDALKEAPSVPESSSLIAHNRQLQIQIRHLEAQLKMRR